MKECYFYLDSTPTHSYMKYLYKYPQSAFPYDNLVATNRDRGRGNPKFELLDTGVFDHDRYFDVFVEYAKASPEDILIQISDDAVLKYEIKAAQAEGQYETLSVLPFVFEKQNYGLALPDESPHLEKLNQALLSVRDTPEWKVEIVKYIGK